MKNPFDHQKEALKDIRTGLKKENRGKVIMATGTGKTLVAWWAAREHAPNSVLALVPSLALARQLYLEWKDPEIFQSGKDLRWLVVCSDASVTKQDDEDADISLEDLHAVVGSVTNDPEEVNRFLTEKGAAPAVVICTYQSAEIVAAGMPGRFGFDLGIFDEAHKTAGAPGKLFNFAMQDKNLRIKKRLFFTATPRVARHYKAGPGKKTEIVHMDDPKMYGPTLHELSFMNALEQELVSDYDVLIPVIQQDGLTREDVLSDKGQALLAKTEVVIKSLKKYNINKLFSFHGTNLDSTLAEGFYSRNTAGFKIYRVSGDQSAKERDNILEQFSGGSKSIVTNARCLGEGVNVPVCDGVAFLAPRKSKVDVIQAVGRACRLDRSAVNPRAKKAYVVIPIFLEAGENIDDAKRRSAFGHAFDTLNALRDHNTSISDSIRSIREQLKSPEAGGPEQLDEGKIRILIDETVRGGIAGMSIKDFRRAFSVELGFELQASSAENKRELLKIAQRLTQRRSAA